MRSWWRRGAMMLVVLLVPAASTRAVAAPAPGDLAGIRDLLAHAPLDLGERDLGNPAFHGDKVAAARAARAGVEAAPAARRILVLVLGIYGSLAAIGAAVCVAWRFPRRLPWEMPVLLAGATAALVVLGAGWNGADALVITKVILTDSSGNGGEQTQIDVETLRQRTTQVAVPYPKSALRWIGAGARFGSPLRIEVERALVEREAPDGMGSLGSHRSSKLQRRSPRARSFLVWKSATASRGSSTPPRWPTPMSWSASGEGRSSRTSPR